MEDFPRTLFPKSTTIPKFPAGLSSWGISGKGQHRSTLQVGRIWTESYGLKRGDDPIARGFWARVNQMWHDREIFNIDHLTLSIPQGTVTGTPLVNGASQTGNSIITDGWAASEIVLKAGDIIKYAGINIVYDVPADVTSDGSGNATIPINPPIFEGGEPADNAPIIVTGVKFRAVINAVPSWPACNSSEVYGGMKIEFREVP